MFVEQCRATPNTDSGVKDGLNLVTMALEGLAHDLKALRNMIPETIATRLSARVRWTRERKSISELMQRVESRKTSLTMVLGLVGLYVTPILCNDWNTVEACPQQVNTGTTGKCEG